MMKKMKEEVNAKAEAQCEVARLSKLSKSLSNALEIITDDIIRLEGKLYRTSSSSSDRRQSRSKGRDGRNEDNDRRSCQGRNRDARRSRIYERSSRIEERRPDCIYWKTDSCKFRKEFCWYKHDPEKKGIDASKH